MMKMYGSALDEPAPVPTLVIALFMLESAFSKWVPPEPRFESAPVSSRLARLAAALVIVLPVRLVVSGT